MNYFALLGLPPKFDLDLKTLEEGYFRQQRLFHPDRSIGKPQAERQQALQRSVDINNAYHTLKKPLRRAQYLLHLQGIAVGTEQDNIKPSPQLLAEVMEWREQAAEAEVLAELDRLDNMLSEVYTQSINTLSRLYAATEWQAMAEETMRLGYAIKAREDISARKKRLAM